jgi:large subunit ribosomal protein L13e
VSRKVARTIGIAVDFRRRSKSQETLTLNVERVKAYMANLIVFPKSSGKANKGDASAEQVAAAKQLTGKLMPVTRVAAAEAPRAITAQDKAVNVFAALRKARSDARLVGVRYEQSLCGVCD